MIRISAGIRNVNVRGLVNSLLEKPLPSSLSAADYFSSAIALQERKENSSFTERHRNPTYGSPASAPFLDVSAGGGPSPKKPPVWRTKTSRGSVAKSQKLIDVVYKLSNTKEEVYGALDAWIAWDLEFPLIAVKKALKTLKDNEEWRRIIQVSKWMLDKGQGQTLATYQLLLQAFDHEGRIEEAGVLWEKLLRDNGDSLSRTMFAQMIAMLDRYDKKKEILKVWADMEELQVRPDPGTLQKVVRAYFHFGYDAVGQALLERHTATTEFRFIKGKRVEVKIQPVRPFRDCSDKVEVKQEQPRLPMNNKSQKMSATETSIESSEGSRLDNGYEQEEQPRLESSNEPKEKPRIKSRNKLEAGLGLDTLEERPNLGTSNGLEEVLNFETSVLQERRKFEISTEVKEGPRFVANSKVKNDGDFRPTLR